MIYQFDIPIYNTNALMLVEPLIGDMQELTKYGNSYL